MRSVKATKKIAPVEEEVEEIIETKVVEEKVEKTK